MADADDFVLLKILNKEFKVACQPDEKAGLLESASYLTDKMKVLKSRGKVLGNDRVAITAALNVSHELRECRQQLDAGQGTAANQTTGGDLEALRQKIDDVLNCAANQNEFDL